MPGPSADERIKRFLKRRAQERAQAEVARQEHDEREQQHERIIERIKAKWTADVDLIAAVLAELQAKSNLVDINLSPILAGRDATKSRL
jgi:hypothetical protein